MHQIARKPYHPNGLRNSHPTQQSFIEENSSLFMNSIWYKGKNEGRNIKPDKSQDYSQEPPRNCIFMNSILAFVFVTMFQIQTISLQQNQNNLSNKKKQNIH